MNCSHSGCNCNEHNVDRGGQKFCSNYCANAASQGSLAESICACGHADCAGSVPAQPA